MKPLYPFPVGLGDDPGAFTHVTFLTYDFYVNGYTIFAYDGKRVTWFWPDQDRWSCQCHFPESVQRELTPLLTAYWNLLQ